MPLGAWLAIWAWFEACSHRHRVAKVMDLGWFFAGAWWFLAPYYLFKVQGRRAFIPVAAYILLVVTSTLFAVVVGTVFRSVGL